jgi:hypothetical protein
LSRAPALKYVVDGTRNHCGGVRRWETVLMLSSWSTLTFSVVVEPPHVPQPSEKVGVRLL